MASQQAKFIGIDLSTTAMSVGVRSEDGHEDFSAVAVRGSTQWHDQPAFLTKHLPALLVESLGELESQGWSFLDPGRLSWSVRQHDMVLLDNHFQPLIPAISWECHVAVEQVRELQSLGIDSMVGPIEPRFILPKLLWVLQQQPDLRDRVAWVATTGDFMAACLTGQLRLSASDALSNALLNQNTKQVARHEIERAGCDASWFPDVISSGCLVGHVGDEFPFSDTTLANDWSSVRQRLSGWSVGAGLGDNHAGAVGCGLSGKTTVVISAGSSGTVVRLAFPNDKLAGNAACFEYYDDRLLLMMLADCAIWYNRFLQQSGKPTDHEKNNQAALAADASCLVRVTQETRDGRTEEVYPENWSDLDWGEQLASTQFSIAVELLLRVRNMLNEVASSAGIVHNFVLTGGLCQSPMFRHVLASGLQILSPGAKVEISDRNDKLAFQTATYGALINAMAAGQYENLPDTIDKLCPRQPCESLAKIARIALENRLKREL